jgi:hypothetical protein
MLRRLGDAGVTCAIAFGVDEAIACLERWGLLRGAAAIKSADWDSMWSRPFGLTDSKKAEQR